MPLQDSWLEITWNDLLSRDKSRILKRFVSLDSDSQKTVLDHLHRMIAEDGWHPDQIESAQAALLVLTKKGD